MSYKYSRKVSYCIAGTIFDPPWLWQRILYIQLGTAAESTDLRHLQRLQCFSLAKCLGLCRSCDQCWGGSQASVGPYGLKLELHGTLAIVFVNTESTWTWSPFYQLWHFIPNSWLPLAKIVSATLVIPTKQHCWNLTQFGRRYQGFQHVSTIWNAPGQVAAYNMLSPTCKTRAGRVVLASKRMWAIQFNGEATAAKKGAVWRCCDWNWNGNSHPWLLSCLLEGDPSQRRLIRGSINEVPTMQLKNKEEHMLYHLHFLREWICTNLFLTHLLPAID